MYGKDHHQVIKSMLQLANIAVAQVRQGAQGAHEAQVRRGAR